MEGGAGAGAGSSERPQSSTPLPSNQAEDHAPPEEVPATLYKQKVRWSLDFLGAKKDDSFERACEFEDLDTSRVKGENTEDLSGELDETDKETASRVEGEAFDVGLQDDVLFNNDVLKGEVDRATDDFVAESIQAAETLEEDDVLPQEARPRGGKRQAEAVVHCSVWSTWIWNWLSKA